MLQDKVILITGSARGIGAATARRAKDYGADVVLHGKSESSRLKALAAELDVMFVACDIDDKSAVEKAVAKIITEKGRIDCLVNNAGAVETKPFLEADDAHWEAQYRTNVLGAIHVCQAVIPHMQVQGGGHIVNVSSIRGDVHAASARGMAYSAAKAAIINLTAAMAKAFAPHITVNAVAPGMTETDMAKTWSDTVRQQANSSLIGRPGKPEEIAEALLFLISDRANFITGQTLVVDGGYEIAGK